MTCPKCRERILRTLDYLRNTGNQQKVKEVQRKWLINIRDGRWKQESSNTIYCINREMTDTGEATNIYCCWHVFGKSGYRGTAHESPLSKASKKKNPKHEHITALFWAFRADGLKERESAEAVSRITGNKLSFILKIAHTRI